MSRTYRRGKPSTNLKFYYSNHIMDREDDCSPYSGELYWKWKFEGTYKEYAALEKVKYHKDGKRGYGIPWTWRNFETRKLRMLHRQEIHAALDRNDLDIVITPPMRDLGWWYW